MFIEITRRLSQAPEELGKLLRNVFYKHYTPLALQILGCGNGNSGAQKFVRQKYENSVPLLAAPIYRLFSQMFRYSTFIGGPTCIWNPINPPVARFAASSSIATAISRPFIMCVSAFPRAMTCS
jgi:hypothetical protein